MDTSSAPIAYTCNKASAVDQSGMQLRGYNWRMGA